MKGAKGYRINLYSQEIILTRLLLVSILLTTGMQNEGWGQDGMNKYRKLISNTLLFGIGTFSSKVLVFLLMPLYTRILSSEDYGIVDLIVQMSNLMLPLVTVGILNAIIRFGLDKSVNKTDVFTTGFLVILSGFTVFLLIEPLLKHIPYMSDYTALIYLYVFMSSMRSLCSQFVRAKEMVRLYALDGVLATGTVIIFNILFLVIFRLGIVGYVLATVASDLCSSVFLFFIAKLWRYLKIRKNRKPIAKEMLRYSIPLIPTTVFWWITNVSSRYIVAAELGSQDNGLYAVAYKIPTMVVLISNIFNDAWQMSAISDAQGRERSKFFTKVFGAFQSIVFLSASGLILFSKVIMRLLVSDEFYVSWRYVPLLVLATSFSCMVTFLGSVYMVEKRSVMALVTTMVGAVLNILFSFLLIPRYGVNGAAFAMLVSYIVVFILRAVSAQRMVHMHWNVPKLALNFIICLIQSFIMIFELPFWILWEILLTCIVISINLKPILLQIKHILLHRKNK